jgi:hypothetical protein
LTFRADDDGRIKLVTRHSPPQDRLLMPLDALSPSDILGLALLVALLLSMAILESLDPRAIEDEDGTEFPRR